MLLLLPMVIAVCPTCVIIPRKNRPRIQPRKDAQFVLLTLKNCASFRGWIRGRFFLGMITHNLVCVADSDMLNRQLPKSHVGLPRDDHAIPKE